MNEFKAVVESFRSDLKKMGEGLSGQIGSLSGRVDSLSNKLEHLTQTNAYEHHVLSEQIGRLLERQTETQSEIREIKNSVAGLDRRVTKLER